MSDKNKNKEKVANKGGRPPKYNIDDLKKILYRYLQDKNPSKITLPELVKYYPDLPLHAWRFNKDIRKEIDTLNKRIENISLVVSVEGVTELLTIPSPEDIINTNYKNKSKLIKVVGDLIDLYQYSFNKSLQVDDLEKENQKLKKQVKTLKNDLAYYEEQLKKMSVQSTSDFERKEKNLKENVIDIKEYSKTNTSFKDIFDD